nr:ATP synthase F0 subunit C [uncultured Oscillibacter sp.]
MNQKAIRIFSLKTLCALGLALLLSLALAAPVLAAEDAPETGAVQTEEDNTIGLKAIAAGIAVGIAAAGGAVGMGLATAKSAESIARQPEAEGKVRTTLMLGLVFIETAIIYALLVVILIIFVL